MHSSRHCPTLSTEWIPSGLTSFQPEADPPWAETAEPAPAPLLLLNTLYPALPYSFRSKRIPSGLTSLTAEFEMGSGVPLSLETLGTINSKVVRGEGRDHLPAGRQGCTLVARSTENCAFKLFSIVKRP